MSAITHRWKKVIDNLRPRSTNAVQTNPMNKIEVDEPLKPEHFRLARVAVHGFPWGPSCIDFDPVQKILAIGTKKGAIRIFGRPGVENRLLHPSSAPVLQIIFLVNTGGLISICKDDLVHLWNIRQKNPQVVHSMQFKSGQLTCGHVPMGSSWLYVGSENGNVHFVSIQQFATSGYVINWNKAIDILQSTHPGRVVKIDSNPTDANKLLIAFSTGFLVLWDLKNKAADARFQYAGAVNDFAWHWEGKTFLTCHNSGLLATWSCKQPQQPVAVICPHANSDTLPNDSSIYEPIHRVQWLPTKSAEPFIIFSGGCRKGLAGGSILDSSDSAIGADQEGRPAEPQQPTPVLTVKRGKRLVALQMDYPLVNFITLCASPYLSESVDAYAVAVLLAKDLVVVDLLSPSYATFENPYPMNLAVSPVTACLYLVDNLGDLVPAFYSVGSRVSANRPSPAQPTPPHQKQQQQQLLQLPGDTSLQSPASASGEASFTSREWPINGGEWGVSYKTYTEVIITGHADGSVRFWDASEVTLTPLYKFRTTRCFNTAWKDPNQQATGGGGSSSSSDVNTQYSSALMTTEQDPFAIRLLHFCPDTRRLLTASSTHVCLLHFSRRKRSSSVPVLDIHIPSNDDAVDFFSASDVFADDQGGGTMTKETAQQALTCHSTQSLHHSENVSSFHSTFAGDRELRVFVPILTGSNIVWPPGYQPTLVCRLGTPVVASSDCKTASCSQGDLPLSASPLPPSAITAISLNTASGLLALGNASGLAIVDYTNQVCLFTTLTLDIKDVYPQALGRTVINSGNATSDGKAGESQSVADSQVAKRVHDRSAAPPRPSTSYKLHFPSRGPPPLSTMSLVENSVSLMKNIFFRQLSGEQQQRAEKCSSKKGSSSQRESKNSNWKGGAVVPVEQVCECHISVVDMRELQGQSSLDNVLSSTVVETMDALFTTSRVAYNLFMSVAEPREIQKSLENSLHSNPSVSSGYLEQLPTECIRTIRFMDSFARKEDSSAGPCLWIGTNQGNAIVMNLKQLDSRATHGAGSQIPYGSIFRLHGEIVYLGFLDTCGEVVPVASGRWEEMPVSSSKGSSSSIDQIQSAKSVVSSPAVAVGGEQTTTTTPAPIRKRDTFTDRNQRDGTHTTLAGSGSSSATPGTYPSVNVHEAPTGAGGLAVTDSQLLVICSDKQAHVLALPSQACLYKTKITETSQVISATIQRLPSIPTSSNGTLCFLSCYLAKGDFVVLSLPSLRRLMDINYLPPTKLVKRSLAFGQHGQAVYMSSPSELVKVTWSSELCSKLLDVRGELFLPCNMPEPPKPNIFKSLFGGGSNLLDREELFGQTTSGKSTSVLVPNQRMEKVKVQAEGSASEIARARNMAIERGERLQQLSLQTQELENASESYARSASTLAAKYKKKSKRFL